MKVRADCANHKRIMAEGALGAEIIFEFARKLIEFAQVTSWAHLGLRQAVLVWVPDHFTNIISDIAYDIRPEIDMLLIYQYCIHYQALASNKYNQRSYHRCTKEPGFQCIMVTAAECDKALRNGSETLYPDARPLGFTDSLRVAAK